jgi:phospholipase/carboxylesterase
MGFSQGGCMVSMLMRHRPERFAAGVICSGFIAEMDAPGDTTLAQNRPPIFWGRDEHDPIIAQRMIEPTEAWLPEHSTLTAKLYPGIEHSISGEEMRDIHAFLSHTAPGATR